MKHLNSGQRELVMAGVTSLAPKVLPVHDTLRHYADIAYSPDGKKIVFSCQKRMA